MDKEAGLFIVWAKSKGYDTSAAYYTDRNQWIFWNPMTSDLWECWQARAKQTITLPVKDATGEH